MDEVRWDLEAITQKWQAAWWAKGIQHADSPYSGSPATPANRGATPATSGPLSASAAPGAPGKKPTFFIHFAYPGISGFLHVGHMRGFTYTDVFARYKRMTGHEVLFPAGFHASGIPAVAFAADVKRGEKTEYLRSNGYDGPIEALTDSRAVVDYFAKVYTDDYWKAFGFLIDERRNMTTIDPAYNKFIQYQMRRLADKGFLVQKPHYAPFCPVAGPVAVDKSETDIKQGGAAEIMEFVALPFALVGPEEWVLPCATLRPETVFGVTNIWMHPETTYHVVRVWQDGAVGDTDASALWLVSEAGKRKLEWQFERAEATGTTIHASSLIGRNVKAPMTGAVVPIVAGAFVDPERATGIVMSVPGHAPFDYAAYRDAGLLETLGVPPKIVDIEGQTGLPAQVACDAHGVKSQKDQVALDAATEQVYSDEFNKGVLNDACGPYAGKRIRAVKDHIKADALQAGARLLRQFSELVISRAGERVDIKRIPDQDFIHYADKAWTEKAKAHAATMAIYPSKYKDELPNVLDWFGDRACVRRGAWLGTEFPFKQGWIVEPIADSTYYSWFYMVTRYLKSDRNPDPALGGIPVEALTDAFFDYVFNGVGRAAGRPPAEAGPYAAVWEAAYQDVRFWGPVDINLGGKEHQTVHFPVYVMNMVGLMDDASLWPKGIFVNWWVTQKAGAKISKSKGGAEPIPGAAKKYGVDPMRLYYCHVGSPHVDIEWDPDIVSDYRNHVERVLRQVDECLDATGGPSPMDSWLDAAWNTALASAKAAYEAYDLRQAAGVLVYEVPDILRWYKRRGGAHGAKLQALARDWAKALCPILPHVAEEIHARCGGTGLASIAAFPEPAPVDALALAAEDYLKAVLADIQTVQRLANLDNPNALTLFTSPAWKSQMLAKAIGMAQGGKFPMGAFMQDVMADPANRARGKDVQNLAGKIPGMLNQLSPGQKALVASSVDEAQVLGGAKEFLAAEFGVEVQVMAADAPDAPDHPKRNLAGPLKPGIAMS